MIAYTAWDSLRVIAREYDADLAFTAGDSVHLAPRQGRSTASATVQRIAERVLAAVAVLFAASGLLV